MPQRYKEQPSLIPFVSLKPALALRTILRHGYTRKDLQADLLAGTVVGLVAIPLGMALAIASGVAPQFGLYTVILGGAVVALLGGSRCQVTGPTAAFVVVLVPIVQKYGFGGLMTAGLLAGFLILFMGLARLGRLIEFIPYPVTTGFTAGIGVVIATIQIKDVLGLRLESMPESYLERIQALIAARGTWSPVELGIAAFTLFILVFWPRVTNKVPSPIVALFCATLGSLALKTVQPEWEIATIGSRFGGIPESLPSFRWPWNWPGADGNPFVLTFETLRNLLPPAFAIAVLGAIESLLSAVVADGMAGSKHDPDAELVALGIGNILCPFFGGIAATGAIARTATNIRFGARSPIASIFHAFLTLLVLLLLAKYVSLLPMAALAALLLIVAYNMSDLKHFFHIVKVSPKSDVTVLLMCFGLTVIFDMVVGVTVGVVLASLLLMKRIASLTTSRVFLGKPGEERRIEIPPGVIIYEIAGPLFFGAANRAMGTVADIAVGHRAIIFDLSNVPAMDATGLVALESAVRSVASKNIQVKLAAVPDQPRQLIEKSDVITHIHGVEIADTVEKAILSLRA